MLQGPVPQLTCPRLDVQRTDPVVAYETVVRKGCRVNLGLDDGEHGLDATEEPMIQLESVTKTYPDGTVAVDHLDLEVRPGELVALVGPSGCGKSTTLRLVNRLIEPTSGRIRINGDDVTHVDAVNLRRHIGYVIQRIGLFPHLTVAANVAVVPDLLGWDKRRTRERVLEMLSLAHGRALRGRRPHRT